MFNNSTCILRNMFAFWSILESLQPCSLFKSWAAALLSQPVGVCAVNNSVLFSVFIVAKLSDEYCTQKDLDRGHCFFSVTCVIRTLKYPFRNGVSNTVIRKKAPNLSITTENTLLEVEEASWVSGFSSPFFPVPKAELRWVQSLLVKHKCWLGLYVLFSLYFLLAVAAAAFPFLPISAGGSRWLWGARRGQCQAQVPAGGHRGVRGVPRAYCAHQQQRQNQHQQPPRFGTAGGRWITGPGGSPINANLRMGSNGWCREWRIALRGALWGKKSLLE